MQHREQRETTALPVKQQVVGLLENVLGIEGRLRHCTDDTPLLGAIPELDSMAVAGVLTGLEERFGFYIDDDEIDGSAFATVGSLVSFVEGKLAAIT
jgi:acyl carrier protein